MKCYVDNCKTPPCCIEKYQNTDFYFCKKHFFILTLQRIIDENLYQSKNKKNDGNIYILIDEVEEDLSDCIVYCIKNKFIEQTKQNTTLYMLTTKGKKALEELE